MATEKKGEKHQSAEYKVATGTNAPRMWWGLSVQGCVVNDGQLA